MSVRPAWASADNQKGSYANDYLGAKRHKHEFLHPILLTSLRDWSGQPLPWLPLRVVVGASDEAQEEGSLVR